jgi:hypothetical protein
MKIKTAELTGPALDWAVAKCEYDELAALNIQYPQHARFYPKISPSTNWAQGGPIIERERITLVSMPDGTWQSQGRNQRPHFHNPTPLIAAMRCFVASKLGEEIDIPEELG